MTGPIPQPSIPLTLYNTSTSQHRYFSPEKGGHCFSEMVASTYKSTGYRNTEHHHPPHCHENLKPHKQDTTYIATKVNVYIATSRTSDPTILFARH
jgi:hypothetical protein